MKTEDKKLEKIYDVINPRVARCCMIGDVLDWGVKKTDGIVVKHIVNRRQLLSQPIEEQSDECIDFIYNLI